MAVTLVGHPDSLISKITIEYEFRRSYCTCILEPQFETQLALPERLGLGSKYGPHCTLFFCCLMH